MLRSRCRCGEPKRRWRLWGPECRERLRLGYNPRPPGFWAQYRDPAKRARTTGLIALRGAPVPLTEVARQEPQLGDDVLAILNRDLAPPGYHFEYDRTPLTGELES